MGRTLLTRTIQATLVAACASGLAACGHQTTVTGVSALLSNGPTGSPAVNNLAVGPFTASALSISPGGSSTLSWSAVNATSVSIDNGIGSVSATGGSVIVNPTATTTYTLTAAGTLGGVPTTVSRSVSVVVLVSDLPAASLIFVTEPSAAQAGTPMLPFSIGALDQNGAATNLPSGSTCNVAVSSNSSGGNIGGTYDGIEPSGGQAVFSDVLFDTAGTYSLTASCTGVANPAPASPTFVVTSSPAETISLISSNIPVYAWMTSGAALNFTLGLVDAYNNPVSSGTVTASLPAGSPATLGGPQSATISGGSATFTGLSINATVSSQYVLTFASGSGSLPVTVSISVPAGLPVPSLPAISSINGMFTDGTSLYLATDQGVAKSTDGGTTFTIVVPASAVGSPASVYVSNGVYYTISSAYVYPQTLSVTSGGITTNPSIYCAGITVPAPVNTVAVIGGVIFVGTQCATFVSTDGGNTFTQRTIPGTNQNVDQIAVASNGTVFMGGSILISSADGGNTFVQPAAQGLPPLAASYFGDMWVFNNVVYVTLGVTDGSGNFIGDALFRSADGGNTFTNPIAPQQNTDIVNMAQIGGVIYAHNLAQATSPLWSSSDGGNTFTPLSTQGGNYVFDDMSMLSLGNTLFASYLGATGYPALLCRSTDGGATFQCSF